MANYGYADIGKLADFANNSRVGLSANDIMRFPRADVQPVRHGRWIPRGDDMWLCSNCKENIIYSEHESDRIEKQRYCCKCGAEMDRTELE